MTVIYTFGPFQLDARDHVLRSYGTITSLTPKAAETLFVLVENAGLIVSKETLLARVWPGIFVEESTLAQNILTLRKVLGKQPAGQDYIGTVTKRGYRFDAPVHKDFTELLFAPSPIQPVTVPRVSPRRYWLVAAALLVIITAAGGSRTLRLKGASSAPALIEAPARLAMLPFVNLDGDPSEDYLSDGFTEEMITRLGQLNPKRLSVIAQTSSMLYSGTKKNTQQIGEELRVDYLLKGSVRREANRIRVSVQLVRVNDQSNLWAASYDRKFRDILELQSQVARSIADEIAVKIAPKKTAGTDSERTVDPEAYQLYLKGRHMWNRRTAEGIQKAISLLQQTIAREPEWAPAHAALADCYAVQFIYRSVSGRDMLQLARKESQRALELDPALAEAHATLAYIEFYEWDFLAAEREFQKSFEINPRYATAHQWYGEFLRMMGRQEEAIQESNRALEIDPLSPIINVEAALPYYYSGDQVKAAQQLRRAIDLHPYFAPAHGHLAMAYEQQGNFDEALQEIRAARTLGEAPWMSIQEGIILARMGKRTEAQLILDKILRAPETNLQFAAIAMLQTALGQREDAISILERAYRDHYWQLTGLRVDPRLHSLTQDPRIQKILRSMGLLS